MTHTQLVAFIITLLSVTACNPFTPKDATNYATKLAATIADRPECQQYKDEIMSHAKGLMSQGKTVGPIVQARADAVKAGCTK